MLVHFEVASSGAPAAETEDFIEPLGDAGSIFVARVHPRTSAREGQPLRLVVNTKRLHFFDPETGLAIDGAGGEVSGESIPPTVQPLGAA